jgi:hypothetical protein
MEEIEQLRKQNADLLLALQTARNAALEEAALVCDREQDPALRHAGPASAIRSMKGKAPAGTHTAGLPGDWQLVMDEVERATRMFPVWPTDPLHAVAILGEEFGELTKAVVQTVYEPHKVQEGELRTEAIQTAAMALRFLASLERYEFAPSAQHVQSAGSSEPSGSTAGHASSVAADATPGSIPDGRKLPAATGQRLRPGCDFTCR